MDSSTCQSSTVPAARSQAPLSQTHPRTGSERGSGPSEGVRGQPGQRDLGDGEGGARHRGPQPGRAGSDQLGVLRRGSNCSAGGSYKNRPRRSQAFVVSQVNGTWGTAEKVPGTAVLNQGGHATINSVSCATADNCGAGGSYTDSSGRFQAFVVNKS
jgi:hypothetical protein